jgi:hypothetical protein
MPKFMPAFFIVDSASYNSIAMASGLDFDGAVTVP